MRRTFSANFFAESSTHGLSTLIFGRTFSLFTSTAAEQAEYEAKMVQRAERERSTGRRLGGRPPCPPVPGPHDGDQYNFTDPESRIMKNPTNTGFEQDYNVQVAVDHPRMIPNETGKNRQVRREKFSGKLQKDIPQVIYSWR